MIRFILVLFLISTSPLSAAEAPQSYIDAVKIQKERTFNENAVLSFVYNTFFLYDKHIPVEEFLKNLVEKDLFMKFPEGELKSHADFKTWYKGVGDSIQSNTHIVESVKVTFRDDGTYGVHVIVLWQAVNRKGEYLKFKADQNWVLVDENGRLKIRDYLVKEAK